VNQLPSLVQWLTDRGLPLQRAVLWAEFVSDALELVKDAHALLRTPDEWGSFVAGCRVSVPTEPELTSGLGDRMRRLWEEADQGSARDRVFPTYERPIPGDHSHGIRKPKADFWFERKFEAGYCAAFLVEAKRLSGPSDIGRKYLAAGGLGCFVLRSPPYTRDIMGGMIGYAHKVPTPNWHERVRTEITVPPCAALRVDYVGLNPVGLKTLASDHERGAIGMLEQVTVLHVMLEFV
jgi:hypothetical protein